MTAEIFKGLSDEEVKASHEKFGTNSTEEEHKSRFWQVVKEIVSEPLFLILVCAALTYFILTQFSEGIIMLLA